MVRTILAFFAICFVGPYVAQAQVLSYEDILEKLSGTWAVPFGEEDSRTIDCASLRIRINIEDRDGQLFYTAQHEGLEAEGVPPHEQIVKQATHSDGRVLPALHISYENEQRVDEDGNAVSWYLFMLDKDQFTWSPAHTNLKGFTPNRTRCDVSSDIS